MDNTNETIKAYAIGSVDRGRNIIKMLEELGATNPLMLKGCNPYFVYYIDSHGYIASTDIESELARVILSSGWMEVKPRHKARYRRFLVDVKEGEGSGDAERDAIAGAIGTVVGVRFDGGTLSITEVTDYELPMDLAREKNM